MAPKELEAITGLLEVESLQQEPLRELTLLGQLREVPLAKLLLLAQAQAQPQAILLLLKMKAPLQTLLRY